MASKFIILAVFAVAAHSAAVVEQSSLKDELSTIRSLEVVTLADLHLMVNDIFDALDGREHSSSELQDIEKKVAGKFRDGYNTNMKALELASKNPSVIEEKTPEAHAALNRVISTIMSMLGKTDTSALEEDAVEQIEEIWGNLYNLYALVLEGDETIKSAIKHVGILATDNAVCATRAISTAIRFANRENSDEYQDQIEMQRKVTLITKIAELIEKFSLHQYIIAHKYDASNADMKAFNVIVQKVYEVIFAFRTLFEMAANSGTVENYDDLEETMNNKFIIALAASVESINSIQSGVSVNIDRTAVLELTKKAVAGIRRAIEIVNKQAEGDINEIQAKVVSDVQSAFGEIYAALAEASRHIPDAADEVEDAAKQAATGIEKAFGDLFAAMTGQLREGFAIADLEYVSLEVEVMRKFDIIRACCLYTSLKNNGVEVPLSLLLNDAVKTASKTEL